MLLTDGRRRSGGVPFAHWRLLAGNLRGKSRAALCADTALDIKFASTGSITINLTEITDLAGTATGLFRDVTPRTFGLFEAAALVDTSCLISLARATTTFSASRGFDGALQFGFPTAVRVSSANCRGSEATAGELTRVSSS